MIFDQVKNGYIWFTLKVSVYLVNVVFGHRADAEEELLVPDDPEKTAQVIGLMCLGYFFVCVCLAPDCVLIGVLNRNLGNLAWIDSMYRMKLLIEKCPRSKVPKPQNKVDFGWFFGCISESINGWFMLQMFWCNTMEQRFMLREPGFGYVGPVASFQGMCCCHYFCTFGRLERWCLLILPKQWRAHIIGQCM